MTEVGPVPDDQADTLAYIEALVRLRKHRDPDDAASMASWLTHWVVGPTRLRRRIWANAQRRHISLKQLQQMWNDDQRSVYNLEEWP